MLNVSLKGNSWGEGLGDIILVIPDLSEALRYRVFSMNVEKIASRCSVKRQDKG